MIQTNKVLTGVSLAAVLVSSAVIFCSWLILYAWVCALQECVN